MFYYKIPGLRLYAAFTVCDKMGMLRMLFMYSYFLKEEKMHQQFDVSPDDAKRAKWPHEIFTINLVFNHILVFATTLGVFSTFPLLLLIVPVTSFVIITYIFVRAKQVATSNEPWFIKSHWRIAAKRNRQFTLLLSVALAILGGGFWLSKTLGWSKVATLALLGGVGLLPFMVTLLLLIILGNESIHLARVGKLPKRFVELNPEIPAASAQLP